MACGAPGGQGVPRGGATVGSVIPPPGVLQMTPEALLVAHDEAAEAGQLAQEALTRLVLALVVGLARVLAVVLAVGAVLPPLARLTLLPNILCNTTQVMAFQFT